MENHNTTPQRLSREIVANIQDMERKIDSFMDMLSLASSSTRDDAIAQIYGQRLHKMASWVQGPDRPSNSRKGHHILEKGYLDQFENNPEEKMGLIQEFLECFPEISQGDRAILLQSFKDLNDQDLYRELENLTNVFNNG